jgi:hypothetical protein
MSDGRDVEMELMLLRRDFEACRQHSCEREDRYTKMMQDYRSEVVGLGKTASAVALETKAELAATLAQLRRDLEALFDLLGGNGHA